MTTCPITKLLANARYYEAEAKKPENAEQKEMLLMMAATSRKTAVEKSMANVQSPEDLAREEATLRRAYRKMK